MDGSGVEEDRTDRLTIALSGFTQHAERRVGSIPQPQRGLPEHLARVLHQRPFPVCRDRPRRLGRNHGIRLAFGEPRQGRGHGLDRRAGHVGESHQLCVVAGRGRAHVGSGLDEVGLQALVDPDSVALEEQDPPVLRPR
jgi:hypothetical protein